jgi:hypothetical protein
MRRSLPVLCLLVVLCSFSFAQQAETTAPSAPIIVPRLIRFSGQINNATGTVGVTFTLHKSQQDETALWIETQNVRLDSTGKYTVLLGATKSEGIPAELFASGEAQWLGIRVEGQPEQARVLLVSVPYALKAAEADTLAGHAANDFVTTDKLSSAVQQEMQQQATSTSSSTPGTGKNPSPIKGSTPTDPATNFIDNNGSQVVLVQQNGAGSGLTAIATTGLAVNAKSTSTAIYGLNTGTGNTSGVEGTTSSPAGRGVYGFNTATTGTNFGVVGSANSTAGIGVFGSNGATSGAAVGVWGSTSSTAGVALKGSETATSGSTTGVLGSVKSFSGTAAVLQNSAGGTLISGQSGSSNTEVFSVDGSGNTTGGQFISTAPSGTAPLVVASQTLVTNLNASFLEGLSPASFAQTASTNAFGMLQTFDAGATIAGELSVTGGTTGPAGSFTAQNGGAGIIGTGGPNSSGSGGNGASFYGGTGSATGGAGLYAGGGEGYSTNGGIGAIIYGGTSTSGAGGEGAQIYGANSSSSSVPGNGLSVTGGIAYGNTYTGGVGVSGYGGDSTTVNGTGGTGAVFTGGNGTSSTGQNYGGTGLVVTGGNSTNNNGPGGDGIQATAGTGIPNGFAAKFFGNTNFFYGSNTAQLSVGDTGCGTSYIGIGIGVQGTNGPFTMAACANYNLASNGTDLLLNAPLGGTIHLRQGNGDSLVIDASSNVSIPGNLSVGGTLSKHAGSFKIDHPLDPANKYLYHSFVESPDMMNIYNGNVVTDHSGFATITLPDWFEALNRDFRYQLTVMGQFAQAIVSKKVQNNQFVIQTDKPDVEVSWQVTGIRHDAYANAHRIPVEQDKPESERGKYFHEE